MKKLFTVITVLTLFQGIARAQQFPVQVTPQLLPPFSVKLSDYYSPGAAGAKLNLLLLLRDFNKPQLQVRLRMSIEGQSVSIRTREDAVYTPLTIESGMPYYVDPSDLAQYFNPNNLDLSGITRQQYEQTGKLPEGFYTFCFEAIEVTTNQLVSNKGCAFAWMTLNEPPILNLPRKAEAVIPINPQNLVFQWTPRHTASPTAAFVTDYIFSIVEMNDNAIAPEAAFISNAPLYTDSVTTTTFLYHAGLPALLEGKKYAWRVQAKAKNGVQDLASFRNQGYSETFWFTYQNNCAVPTGVSASPQGQRVGIEWNANPAHLEYKVEYRKANSPDAVWFEIGNTLPRVSIADLDTSTTYQYRVGGACEYGRYTFGNLLEFTTNGANATTVPQCGIDPNLTEPPQTLLTQLNAGDVIHAGDYDVKVTSVTGQTSFSGEGYVRMSWLADARVAVRFTNIGVNTDYKLASGVIETTYDPTEAGIADAQEFVEFFKSFTELFDNIKNYTRDLTDGSDIDANKIADFTNTLGLMQSSFLDRIEDESLRQETLTAFENLNNALESLAEGESCECESSGGSSGGGNFYRGRFSIFSIECCKQVIDQSLSNLESAGNKVNSDLADKENALGNYLLAKGYYLTPIHTPLKLPANSLILKSSKYTLPGLSKPYLMRFQANNKIYEADIRNGLFYGYKNASEERYPLTYNSNDFTSEPYKIYALEQSGSCDNAILKQQPKKFYGSFCSDRIDALNQGAQIGGGVDQPCGVEPDGVYENGFDVSTSGACDAELKSVDFDWKNGIVRQISKDKIDQYISSNLDTWMTEKETYGEVFIHKIGENSIKHFTRNKNENYNGLAAMDIAKSNFLRGDLEEDYAVWLEYDESKGQVKIYQQFRSGYLNPTCKLPLF